MTAKPDPLDKDAKLAALERLLADSAFRVSQRNRSFLRFVVEESLAGRSDRIKAYTIAVDVFGRGADFDGMLDPVVRIEAGRLRQALAKYYAEEGQSERIRIGLPRGGYTPAFELVGEPECPSRDVEAPAPPPPALPEPAAVSWAFPQSAMRAATIARGAPAPARPPRFLAKAAGSWRIAALAGLALLGLATLGTVVAKRIIPDEDAFQSPIVMIARPQALTGDAQTTALSRTLAQSLPAAIARFEGLTVVAARPDQPDQDLITNTLQRELASRRIYLVTTSVKVDGGGARALWQLMDGRTQALLWSATMDTSFAQNTTGAVEDETAQKIARALASQGAAISSFELRAIPDPIPPGYACVTRSRQYIANLTDAQRKLLAECLETTVAQTPEYAEAWAMLAYIYVDESRVRIDVPEVSKAALAKAEAAAARAEALAPFSALTQQAISTTAYQKRDLARFETAGRRAIAINPSDPNLQVILGNRLFLLGRYDESMAVLKQAIASRPAPVATDNVNIIYDLYRRGDYAGALALADKAKMPGYFAYWLVIAAIHGQTGNTEGAADALKRLNAIRTNYGAVMRADFRNRGIPEAFIDQVADGLRKAGMPVE
ncbi:hypothetical protein [Bosea caraganae]|nr:hypothetical protein [Bosea caraganae]